MSRCRHIPYYVLAPRDGYERSNKFYASLEAEARNVNKIEGNVTNDDADI